MERVLDTDEIILAIKQLKPQKVPGLDGLPCEFYKCFKDKLAPLLTEAFNGRLHDSVRE